MKARTLRSLAVAIGFAAAALAHHRKVTRIHASAAAPAARSCFWLSPGAYAIAVYHDQNGRAGLSR